MLRCDVHEDSDSRHGWRSAGNSAGFASWKGGPVTWILFGLVFWTAPSLRAGTVDNQPPSVPEGLTPSSVSATGFTVGWRPSTDNVKVTGYEVSSDGKTCGTITGLSKTFTGLAPESCYRISVRARDAKGNWSACSTELSVSTLPDRTPPTVPTEVVAGNLKLKAFTIAWAASEDDVKVTAYEVFRDGVSLGMNAGRSRSISGLSVGTTYSITVRARDAAGNWSALSTPITVKTLSDTSAPTVPEGACAQSIKATRFVLKWVPSKDDVKVGGYEISRDGVSLGVAPGATRRIADLAPLTNYSLRIRAVDEAGNWSAWSAPIQVRTVADTTRPSTPLALVATRVSANGFLLTWSASSDNVGVTGYEIFRDGVSVGTIASPSLPVTGLHAGTTYAFRVRSRDAAGNWSGLSAALKVKTLAVDAPPLPPAAPVGLASSDVTATSFVLNWSMAPTGGTPVGFEVFLNGISAGTAASPGMTFSALSPGSIYRACVRARNVDGLWSPLSAELVVQLEGATFLGGFEATEGYQLGPLHAQNGWEVTGSAEVVATPVFAGRQALSVPAGSTVSFSTHSYPDSSNGITFLDFFVLPAAGLDADSGVFFETGNAEVSLTKESGRGVLQAFDGDGHGGGSWISTGLGPALTPTDVSADWMRVTLRTDTVAKRWDLYFNGHLIAADLGFVSDDGLGAGILTLGGNRTTAVGFDDLFVSGENPIANDADHDGMDDAWETAHGLSPRLNDRHGDPDGDGIDNLHESLLGTDPNRADTDNDGIPDGWEVAHGLNPTSAPDALRDDDGDGLTNHQEYQAGSNPIDFYNGRGFILETQGASQDTVYSYDLSGRLVSATYGSGRSIRFVHDGAGNLLSVTTSPSAIADWRAAHGLPRDGSGQGADSAVVAGDGLPNLAKYAFGLDPRASVIGDFPAVSRIHIAGHGYLTLTYQRPDPSPIDLTYTVEVSADGSVWESMGGAVVPMAATATNGIAVVTTRDARPCDGLPLQRRIRLKIERKASQ